MTTLAYYFLIALISQTMIIQWFEKRMPFFNISPWISALLSLIWPLLLVAFLIDFIVDNIKK